MALQAVDNDWFVAEFPSDVVISELPPDEFAKTTEFAAEIEPFGIFTVRATQMPIDPFVAGGPRFWVGIYGDNWRASRARCQS